MSDIRDTLRGAIFSGSSFKRESIVLFGQEIEVRQPSVEQLRKLSDISKSAKDKNAIINLMIDYTYVPGTDEKVFEQADYEQLSNLPAGDWLITYQKAWVRLAGINEEELEKN
jgi:hypothetical protein